MPMIENERPLHRQKLTLN